MSHIVTVKLEVKDAEAIRMACERLGEQGAKLTHGTEIRSHRLYSGQEVRGISIQLPGWSYPAVVNPETGEIFYDNYNGNWGSQVKLDAFVQAYTVERLRMEAQRHGHYCSELVQENGDIVVQIQSF